MSEHSTFAESIMRSVLASPATLAKLAARGMFASVPLNMPPDILTADITILFEGEVSTKSIIEVYAPGDESGWAVTYKPGDDGMHTGETELIFGQWQLVRGEHDFSRHKSKETGLVDGEPPLGLDEERLVDVLEDKDEGRLTDALGINLAAGDKQSSQVPVTLEDGDEAILVDMLDEETHYAAFGSDGDA